MVFDTLPPLAYLCALCDKDVLGSGVTCVLKERVNENWELKYMLKFVVQAKDLHGNWRDHQAAWDYNEAKQVEFALLNNEAAWSRKSPKKQTRIVPADRANNLYHL
jgi:hypothetical protein